MRIKAWVACGAIVGTGLVLSAPTTAVAGPVRCGQVLVAKSDWLGGEGVPVRSNGAGGSSCNGFSVRNRAVQYGGGWQCVELAARLYHVKGWGTVFAGRNGGARYIPEGSGGLEFHANGSGYVPVPGDLVIEAHGYYGHVTVVDRVEGNTIHAVEQNASRAGRKTYELEDSAAFGSYGGGFVRGFMHSPRNVTPNPSATAPVVFAPDRPTLLLDTEPRTKVRANLVWNPPDGHGAQIRGYQVNRRQWNPTSGRWSQWSSVYLPPEASSHAFTSGRKRSEYRVRAANAIGWSRWSPATSSGL